MAKERMVKQLYFTRHDRDLYEAIQNIPEGDQNHEIRTALRQYFLGDRPIVAKILKEQTKNVQEDVMTKIKTPDSMFR